MSAKGQRDPGEDHASRVGAESPCSDMKRAVAKKLIERYFYQLTDGCGNPDCDNQNCASSGKVTNLTPNQAAAQAIQLFSQEARLCDGTQPSKVARTTLEPGPASLAKSLPVKSVNPTCSEEGIASNIRRNPVPLVNDLIEFPVDGDKKIKVLNQLKPFPEGLSYQNIHSSSNGRLTKETGTQIDPTLNKDFNLIPMNKTRTVPQPYQFCEPNHTYVPSVFNERIFSDGDHLSAIINRCNIRIPNYNDSPIKTRNKHQKNVKRPSRKQKEKKKSPHKMKVPSKRQFKNTSRYVTKLLVLNLYLKYVAKKKNSCYTTNIK